MLRFAATLAFLSTATAVWSGQTLSADENVRAGDGSTTTETFTTVGASIFEPGWYYPSSVWITGGGPVKKGFTNPGIFYGKPSLRLGVTPNYNIDPDLDGIINEPPKTKNKGGSVIRICFKAKKNTLVALKYQFATSESQNGTYEDGVVILLKKKWSGFNVIKDFTKADVIGSATTLTTPVQHISGLPTFNKPVDSATYTLITKAFEVKKDKKYCLKAAAYDEGDKLFDSYGFIKEGSFGPSCIGAAYGDPHLSSFGLAQYDLRDTGAYLDTQWNHGKISSCVAKTTETKNYTTASAYQCRDTVMLARLTEETLNNWQDDTEIKSYEIMYFDSAKNVMLKTTGEFGDKCAKPGVYNEAISCMCRKNEGRGAVELFLSSKREHWNMKGAHHAPMLDMRYSLIEGRHEGLVQITGGLSQESTTEESHFLPGPNALASCDPAGIPYTTRNFETHGCGPSSWKLLGGTNIFARIAKKFKHDANFPCSQ